MAESKKPWWRRVDPRHLSVAKWAMIFGAVLGLVCHFLPHEYRGPCKAIAALCGGME